MVMDRQTHGCLIQWTDKPEARTEYAKWNLPWYCCPCPLELGIRIPLVVSTQQVWRKTTRDIYTHPFFNILTYSLSSNNNTWRKRLTSSGLVAEKLKCWVPKAVDGITGTHPLSWQKEPISYRLARAQKSARLSRGLFSLLHKLNHQHDGEKRGHGPKRESRRLEVSRNDSRWLVYAFLLIISAINMPGKGCREYVLTLKFTRWDQEFDGQVFGFWIGRLIEAISLRLRKYSASLMMFHVACV